jgi:hypothetical protein
MISRQNILINAILFAYYFYPLHIGQPPKYAIKENVIVVPVHFESLVNVKIHS